MQRASDPAAFYDGAQGRDAGCTGEMDYDRPSTERGGKGIDDLGDGGLADTDQDHVRWGEVLEPFDRLDTEVRGPRGAAFRRARPHPGGTMSRARKEDGGCGADVPGTCQHEVERDGRKR